MSSKAVITAVTNQKGGTGKTTTCENLGAGLVMNGKKVLLVDFDPQASLSISLGYPKPEELPVTIADMMKKVVDEKEIRPGEGILHHEEGMDLMPSSIELSGIEVALVNTISRETVLKEYLESVKRDYDFVLLDCSPSLDADHQCHGCGGHPADSGPGFLSSGKGIGAAVTDRE